MLARAVNRVPRKQFCLRSVQALISRHERHISYMSLSDHWPQKVVGPKEAWFIERRGQLHSVVTGKSVFLVPFLDRVAAKVELTPTFLFTGSCAATTKDQLDFHITGTLYYQVMDSHKLYESLACDYKMFMRQIIHSSVQTEIAKMTFDQVFEQRDAINENILVQVSNSMKEYGIECSRFELGGMESNSLFELKQGRLLSQLERMNAADEGRLTTLLSHSEGEAIKILAEYRSRERQIHIDADMEYQKKLTEFTLQNAEKLKAYVSQGIENENALKMELQRQRALNIRKPKSSPEKVDTLLEFSLKNPARTRRSSLLELNEEKAESGDETEDEGVKARDLERIRRRLLRVKKKQIEQELGSARNEALSLHEQQEEEEAAQPEGSEDKGKPFKFSDIFSQKNEEAQGYEDLERKVMEKGENDDSSKPVFKG